MTRLNTVGRAFAWWRALPNSHRLRFIAFCVLTLVGMIWLSTLYDTNWYLFDEWTTIDRSLGPWSAMFDSHQSHLQLFSYVVYRVQRTAFGLDGHQIPWIALVVSVAAMQVTLAMLLRRLGLSAVFAFLLATLVTYFGPGAQNVVFEFQWSQNAALALCFLAAFIALDDRRTTRRALVVSALLVLAAALDSGLAAFATVVVGTLIVLLWPRSLVLTALVPPALVHLAWLTIADQGPDISASFGTMWTFGSQLLLQTAAALVGGGETNSNHEGILRDPAIPISTGKLGLFVLLIAAAVVAFGVIRRRLSRPVFGALIGASGTALLAIAVLAKTRSFFIATIEVGNPNLLGSRYVQWIGVFLVIGVAPAIAASLRSPRKPTSRVLTIAVGAALIAIFIVNLGQLGPVVRFHEAQGQDRRRVVAETVTLIKKDCGPTRRLIKGSKSYVDLNPEITVGLLRELLARGSFSPTFGIPPTPEIRDAVCRPDP